MTQQEVSEGKGLAIVSYFAIIGVIIAYFLNNDKKNPFINFHIRQSMGLWIMFHLLGFVATSFDNWGVTGGFYLCFSILFLYAIIGAISGKTQTIPFLGNLFQKWFSNIGN
ncbi:hypothetical protein FEZ18_13105 [Oceanihabitans sp. IOP_32]|uniref:hypothetical protein n=1 Tax=Oceanihabitans sp. IOP_32 TaxID=2529032 RepID=UPI001293EB29|nr:hypothetical protein [Oceanihabitans sp. IOP_32]QFZ55668.1 hypothetical protein FEZ18_13105 [Oceanihabitans sp. IOP_32]